MFAWDRLELDPERTTYPMCIASAGGFQVVAVSKGIWRSTDRGASWQPCVLGGPIGGWSRAAWAGDDGLVCVVGDGATVSTGIISVSQDGGESFCVADAPTTQPLYGVAGHGDALWAVGGGGMILHSADRGRTWARSQPAGPHLLSGIWRAPEGRLWVSGTEGTVLTSDDGQAWVVSRRSGRAYLYGIGGGPGQSLCAPAGGGTVFMSTDGGAKWTAKRTKTKAYFYAGMACTGDDLWVGGNDTLLRCGDGKAWQRIELPPDWRRVADLHAISEDEIWIAGDDAILRGRRSELATGSPQTE